MAKSKYKWSPSGLTILQGHAQTAEGRAKIINCMDPSNNPEVFKNRIKDIRAGVKQLRSDPQWAQNPGLLELTQILDSLRD